VQGTKSVACYLRAEAQLADQSSRSVFILRV
jgi:hypothetical protein